jgi:hypothetical protein
MVVAPESQYMRRPAALAAMSLLAPLLLAVAGAPAEAATFAAHRALYALTLDPSKTTDVVAASGTMGYEVMDACDGWAVRQRLDMTITNHDGQDIHMVSDYATWESKDGLSFRYHMKQTTDDAVTSQTDGEAKLDKSGGGGQAHYTLPEEGVKPLPVGTLFPMAHTGAILDAAAAGKRFLAIPLFDGTVDSGVQDSSIIILGVKKPTPNHYPALSTLSSTRVRLAFFDRDPPSETPDYEVAMTYWENGVADDLQMDFGDFTVDAKMNDFKPLPHRC